MTTDDLGDQFSVFRAGPTPKLRRRVFLTTDYTDSMRSQLYQLSVQSVVLFSFLWLPACAFARRQAAMLLHLISG